MKTIRQIYIRGVDRTGDVAAIAEVKNAYRIRFQNSPKTYFYPKKQIRLLERSPALGEAWPEIFSYFKDFCLHAAEHEPSAEGRSAWTLARRNLKRVEVRSARDTALADYLQAQVRKRRLPTGQALIYPFGCNQSQKKAVEAAFSASISVIQGPPGTGKTQTILNILANILAMGKSVAVASNNNQAIANIHEKLQSQSWKLDWIAADLGRAEKRQAFFERIPSIGPVEAGGSEEEPPRRRMLRFPFLNRLALERHSKELDQLFADRIAVQSLKEEHAAAQSQLEAFLQEEKRLVGIDLLASDRSRALAGKSEKKLARCERRINALLAAGGFWRRTWLRALLYLDGVKEHESLLRNPDRALNVIALLRLKDRLSKLDREIERLEFRIARNASAAETLIEESKSYFKRSLSDYFRGVPTESSEWTEKAFQLSATFFRRFPLVTSTTFSLPACAPKTELFDFLILDEASQINLPTAAGCLACARNAVIVGDPRQLPAVLPSGGPRPAWLRPESGLNASEASILDSVTLRFLARTTADEPAADGSPPTKTSSGDEGRTLPITTLLEHYRSHPDIIGFCNRMFYGAELVPMTTREDRPRPFVWIDMRESPCERRGQSVVNERQAIQTIAAVRQLLSEGFTREAIGIVTPYRAQKALLMRALPGIQVDTVHGFQGAEKSVILYNAVENIPTRFNNDPHLVNVAVSRAKDRFVLLSSDFTRFGECCLGALIRYIEALDPQLRDLRETRFRSIFDILYSSSASALPQRRPGESPAEAIVRRLLSSKHLAQNSPFALWSFVQEYPLRLIPRQFVAFNESELLYMRNNARLDFLVYHAVTKEPLCAVEVDGASFHRPGSKQHARDLLKNAILEKIGLPYIRLSTRSAVGNEELRLLRLFESVRASRSFSPSEGFHR